MSSVASCPSGVSALPEGMRLRRMRWWDLPEVSALDGALFRAQAWSLATFWSELAGVDETRHYIVVEQVEQVEQVGGARLVGYGGLLLSAGSADVATLGVAPEARRRGLGRALLQELLGHAALRGVAQVMLEVAVGNAPAIALYRRAGFEVISRRRGYYQPSGEDALIMRARLDRSLVPR